MRCHICNAPIDNDAPLIKCKLCCDGLEHDACNECSVLYARYKRAVYSKFNVFNWYSRIFFKRLQAARRRGIERDKQLYPSQRRFDR